MGCYSPLKRAYGDEISALARRHVTHISKTEFLPAFRAAHDRVFKKENILASFRGAGLVPLDPDAVLSKLNVKLRTPTPPALETTPWEPKTPRTLREVDSQSAFVLNKIPRPAGSSPSSLKEAVVQLTKGTIAMAHELVLLRAEMTDLREANKTLTKRKSGKRKYIQTGGSLTAEEAAELMAPSNVGGRDESGESSKRARTGGGATQQRRCGRCGILGHNLRTCKLDTNESKNSK